jgi:hypothetical protein
MLHATQGNTRGEFSIAVTAGRYLVAAVRQDRFTSYPIAERNILPMTSEGVPVEVTTREIKDVKIRIKDGL